MFLENGTNPIERKLKLHLFMRISIEYLLGTELFCKAESRVLLYTLKMSTKSRVYVVLILIQNVIQFFR